MNEIYLLVGKILREFQHIESILSLIHIYNINKTDDIFEKNFDQDTLEKFLSIDSKTMGQKLKILESDSVLDSEQDVLILTYIINMRNYIAHSFFIDNDFDTEESINNIKIELRELFQNVKLIERALAKFAKNLSAVKKTL